MRKPSPNSWPVIVLITALPAFASVSTDMYLPALPSMAEALKEDAGIIQLTLSIFLLGFSSSQLIYGPLSDRFGRRPLLVAGVFIYAVTSFMCSYASSVEMLLALRFFQSVGACAGPVISRAIVRDIYDGKKAAEVLSYMSAALALTPAFVPHVGSYINSVSDWESIFIFMGIFGTVIFTAILFMLEETNRHKTIKTNIFKNYIFLLTNREYMAYTLSAGLNFGGIFALITGSSFIIIEIVGLSPEQYSFCITFIMFVYIASSLLGARIVKKTGIGRIITFGTVFSFISGLVLAGFSIADIETLLSVLVPCSLFYFSCGWIMPNAMAGSITPFPDKAGAASSMHGFLKGIFGSIAGFAVGWLHDGTTKPMCFVIALCCFLALTAFLVLKTKNYSSSGS